jgi:hypothetical protein
MSALSRKRTCASAGQFGSLVIYANHAPFCAVRARPQFSMSVLETVPDDGTFRNAPKIH